MTSITTKAYAKINLVLSVGPPVAQGANQGMHPIASWFHAIDLFDDITITHAPSGSTTIDISWAHDAPRPTPIDWPPQSDLAFRAHQLLEQHIGKPLPCHIAIKKRIPTGAGLGGGSSNAASTLLTLNTLFNLNTHTPTLASLSQSLGSDIPFFLDPHSTPHPPPRPAIVSNLGDQIQRTHTHADTLLLITPPFAIPTGPVYHAFDAANPKAPANLPRITHLATQLSLDSSDLFNDLLLPAQRVEPRLTALMHHIKTIIPKNQPLHMTGSGSVLFILTPTPDETLHHLISLQIASNLDDFKHSAITLTQLI